MNKQTKQMIALIGLIVVAGAVALWQFVLKGDDVPPPPPASNVGTIEIGANPNAGTPGTGPANPNMPGGGAVPAGTPAVKSKYEAPGVIPPRESFTEPDYKWTVLAPDSGENWEKERGRQFWQYDPLFVQNLDVVEPDRKKYIDELKEQWQLDGITEMEHIVKVEVLDAAGKPVLNAEGQPVTREERQIVPEAWFRDRLRPYKEKDRLPGTRFVIEKIYRTPYGQGVSLRGDTGALIDMPLIKAGRYED